MIHEHANIEGIFIRLKRAGDRITGAFCGEPYAREVIWTGKRFEQYDKDLRAHRGRRPRLRVMMNFYVPAVGAMKIFEGTQDWFRDVHRLRDRCGLDKWIFEIQRYGNPGERQTTYDIEPSVRIDAEMRARIAAADQYDLAAIAAWAGQPR